MPESSLMECSLIILLGAILLLALPLEKYIPSVWLWPFVFVGVLGLILYFVIYFIHPRGH